MPATQNEKGRGADTHTTPATLADDSGSAALVHVRGGLPFMDLLTIAREFGRFHKHVLCTLNSLIADGTIGRPNVEPPPYHDEWNREQRLFALIGCTLQGAKAGVHHV
jgi:hypothetical protein